MTKAKKDNPVVVNLTLSEAKKTFAKLTPEDQHEFSHWAIEQAHIDEKDAVLDPVIIEAEYPFHFSKDWGLCPGCEGHEEYDCGRVERFLTAHRMGKILIEVVSTVDMPGRYLNRVFYKKRYLNPDGLLSAKSELKIMTEAKFESFEKNPFPYEYEYDAIETPKWLRDQEIAIKEHRVRFNLDKDIKQ